MAGPHPTNKRKAALFHLAVSSVGAIHIIAGVVMLWYHFVAAKNHWDDRDRD